MSSQKLFMSGAALLALLAAACTDPDDAARDRDDAERLVLEHLATFDDLDYNVFSGQSWVELHRSHAQDVVVHWPDGRKTTGIDTHIEDLKTLFVWAPDTRIKEHPVKLGQGDWTAVIGIMEGTFTQPMPTPDGGSILPTGKAYKIKMATISQWNAAGTMDEEYLFWDNQEFNRQIGLAP